MSADTKTQELAVQIKGEIVKSNFDNFKATALAKIESMDYTLVSDEDFKKADQDVKDLKQFEKSMDIAQDEMLKQLDDVYALMEGVKEIKKASADCRLAKSKEIKERKEKVKQEILDAAFSKIIATSIGTEQHDALENSVKGKRSFATMKKDAEEYVDALNKSIQECRDLIDAHVTEHGASLVPDADKLELGTAENLKTELALRLERKAREEAEAKQREDEKKAAEQTKAEETPAPVEHRSIPAPPPLEPVSQEAPAMNETLVTEDEGMDEATELQNFLNVVRGAFSPVRTARQALKHPENVKKAAAFADAASAAYLAMEGGSDE